MRYLGRPAPSLGALLLVLAAAAVLGAKPVAADDVDLVVDRFETSLEVAENATVMVTERICVDFGDIEHRGILRERHLRSDIHDNSRQLVLPDDRTAADFHRVIETCSIWEEACTGDPDTRTASVGGLSDEVSGAATAAAAASSGGGSSGAGVGGGGGGGW